MTENARKLKARDEFIAFTERLSGEKFGKLSSIQQSHALTRFYVKEIHNRLRSEISDEDLDLAVVDSANDLGCDLIHRDDNHVLVIQTKYRATGTKEKPEEVSYFQSLLKRLSDPSLKGNEKLLDQLSLIDWKNDSFTFAFITFGILENQARKLSEQDPTYPAGLEDFSERCEWIYLDEQRLNEELRSAIALQRGPSEKMQVFHAVGEKGSRGAPAIIKLHAGDYRSYLMALDARRIINAYHQLGRDSLFSLNIRNFIGNTATNKKIVETARGNPEKFFLFNNGISCVCRTMNVFDDRIEVIGLQVINGAQTVKALVNAGRERLNQPSPWTLHLPNILVRITEIPGEGYGDSAKVREQVTQFNNTQNVVKVSDFRSNDLVQEALKEQFRKISWRGKEVFYMPKRTDSPPKNREIVRFEEFAKTVYAFLEDPVSFSGATAFLFDDIGGGYNKVFGDGEVKWEKMPEDEFRLRAAIYWLSREFEAKMREDRKTETDPDTKAALERKWVLMYSSRKVFEHYYPNDQWKAELRKIYKGDWEFGEGARGQLLKKIYYDAKAGVVTAYKTSKKYEPGFVHRNWMRSKDTPGKIAEILKDSVLAGREPLASIPS